MASAPTRPETLKRKLRSLAVKRYIRTQLLDEGWLPGQREIAEAVGLSLSYTHVLIRDLVDRGDLREPHPGIYALPLQEWRVLTGQAENW